MLIQNKQLIWLMLLFIIITNTFALQLDHPKNKMKLLIYPEDLINVDMEETMPASIEKNSETSLKENAGQAKELNKILDNYFEEYLKLFPSFASQIGDYRYNDRLENDISYIHRLKQKELYSRYLNIISKVNREELRNQDKLSYDIFKSNLNMQLDGLNYNFQLLPVNQIDCMPISFANMGSGQGIHPFNTLKDYQDFLNRIKYFSEWVDTAVANMRKGIKEKVVLPRIIIERTISEIGNIISEDVTKSIFYGPINAFPKVFNSQEKERLKNLYGDAIKSQINPAYTKLFVFLKSEYLPAGRTTIAWSDLPDGKNWYEYLVRLFTTTDKSPDEIYQLGLKEVERIKNEMIHIKNQVLFKGDLKGFMQQMRTDPELYYTKKEDLINGYKEIKNIVASNIPYLFGNIPNTDFEIRPVPEFMEKSEAGAYYVCPSQDGSRPGVFYANTYDLKSRPKYDMQCTFLHEALPGHHFQRSVAQEQKNLPKFRNFANYGAYIEGWALYSESLGNQLGLYKDPYNYFGMLSSEIFRAMRLVVDVGIHEKNWTREQVIQYLLDNSAFSETELTAEAERYIAWPGQALCYKVGELTIKRLRDKATTMLGSKFDLKAFHDELLKNGAMPLNILEKTVNDYINTLQGSFVKQ